MDSSRRVLSDEYPFARVSVIFHVFFASFCIGQIHSKQHKGLGKLELLLDLNRAAMGVNRVLLSDGGHDIMQLHPDDLHVVPQGLVSGAL